VSYHLARGFSVPLPLLRWHARASHASVGQEKHTTNEKKEGDVTVAVGDRPDSLGQRRKTWFCCSLSTDR